MRTNFGHNVANLLATMFSTYIPGLLLNVVVVGDRSLIEMSMEVSFRLDIDAGVVSGINNDKSTCGAISPSAMLWSDNVGSML
jgi:hypothetical protein